MQGVLFARSTQDEETTAAFVNLLIVILLISYDFCKGCTFSVTKHFLKKILTHIGICTRESLN